MLCEDILQIYINLNRIQRNMIRAAAESARDQKLTMESDDRPVIGRLYRVLKSKDAHVFIAGGVRKLHFVRTHHGYRYDAGCIKAKIKTLVQEEGVI